MPRVTDRVPPFALVLAGIASVQFGAALARTMFDDLGAAGTSLIRVFFAALVLMLVFRPDPRRYDVNALRWVLLFGVTLGLMNLTFYLALGRLDLGVAVTIEFIGPLAVAVFGSRRRLDLVWAALAGIGIVLLANPGPGESLDTLGLVYILIAAACWAVYILLSAATGRRFPGSSGLAIAMGVAAVAVTPVGIIAGGRALLRPEVLGAGLGIGLLSSIIPYSVELEALRRVPAKVFGIWMSLEPAVAALVGLVMLGQSLAGREWAAIGCVVVASAGAAWGSRRPAPPPEA